MNFSELGLNPSIVTVLDANGYLEPTPIQAAAIPAILDGEDILAGAKTGTGKTAAFILPVIQKMTVSAESPEKQKIIKALILTPTRELAQQVNSSIKRYGKSAGVRSAVVYGGVGIGPQVEQIKKGVDLLVATPGRLLDLHKKRVVNLRSLQFLIFDEADRMLDMGFRDEVKTVISKLPKREQQPRQVMLFSATLNDQIYKFSKNLLNKPKLIEVDQRNSASENVAQIVYNCDPERRFEIVSYLIKKRHWKQVMVFSRTKEGADKLAQYLQLSGIQSEAIHADRSQLQRDQVLNQFRQGELQVLVATDVAARGIDIGSLSAVINLEIPFKAEDYIHRIGRTGRAGESGEAVTLLIEEENHLLEEIEILLDDRLPQQWLTGFEPDLTREINLGRKNSRAAQKKRAKKRALK